MSISDVTCTISHALKQFTVWRLKHISNKNFVLLVSVLTGVIAGLAAVFLKSLAHHIEDFVAGFNDVTYYNFLYFLFPAIGILLTVLYVQVVQKGKLGRGISNILYSVARKSGDIEPDKTYSHIITSALTVGFGGSAGMEAPIVVTGSAIGSNTAKILNLTDKERILLLACGTAAGVSAIFVSPIAGVIFAMEVLLLELTVPAFIPLLIASATATVISKLLHNRQLFHLITSGWDIAAVPYYILFGILLGFLSVYISRTTLWTEGWIERKKGVLTKALAGGIGLGILIFILPPLYGEGYSTIENLLQGRYDKLVANSLFYEYKTNHWFILLFVATLMMVKVFATSVTIASGGNGGIFATCMLTGALAGFFWSFGINTSGITHVNETNFIAVGMAGIIAGVIHAPLTAIFLIAEITGGYVLFVPLMIVSATSYFIARYFEPYTIYTKKLAEKGDLISGDKDKTVLNLMDIRKILETDFIPVKPFMSLRELLPIVTSSRRNVHPVLNENGEFRGILTLDTVRGILFDTEKYDNTYVKDLMKSNVVIVHVGEEMYGVMQKFDESGAFNLPVIENGKYIGFISKSNIFTIYRSLLIEESKAMAL